MTEICLVEEEHGLPLYDEKGLLAFECKNENRFYFLLKIEGRLF